LLQQAELSKSGFIDGDYGKRRLIHLRPPELKKSSRTPYATTDLAEQIGDSSPDYGHIAQKQPNYEPIQGPVSIPPTPPAGEAGGEGGGRSRERLGVSQGKERRRAVRGGESGQLLLGWNNVVPRVPVPLSSVYGTDGMVDIRLYEPPGRLDVRVVGGRTDHAKCS
jgi:hypothetical protein